MKKWVSIVFSLYLLMASSPFIAVAKQDVSAREVSKDGMRQFRYGKHETKNLGNHHAHFETYDKSFHEGGKLIEKSVVEVIK